jgi:integrase
MALHKRLTVVGIRAIKKPGRYADGGGLYLLVKPDGRRTWLFRYRDRTTQKLRDKGLGPFADVGLEKAREKAAEARRTLLDGADPIDSTRQAKEAAQRASAQRRTFGHCAEAMLEAKRPEWRNAKHAYQWEQTLRVHCAALWPLPVGDVDTPDVLAVLEPLWQTKTETATRVRQRIEAVLNWAAARKYRTGENVARWKGHLDHLLPAPTKLKKVTHLAALPYSRMHELAPLLEASDALSAKALLLQILTATRPNEAAAARWDEFDLSAKLWTIPAERMKAGKAHEVPLPPRAVAMLEGMHHDSSGFLFPGNPDKRGKGPRKPMTTAAPLKTLRGLLPDLTAHGFRSSFRDWAADQTTYPRDLAEASLAHTLKDKTEAAYRRSTMLDKRREMMAAWEAHCFTAPPAANVSGIGEARARKRKA